MRYAMNNLERRLSETEVCVLREPLRRGRVT